MTCPAPLAVASSAPRAPVVRPVARPSVLPALRRVAADAGGCPATAPSAIALDLAWRVRADALFLAPAHAAASPHPDVRRDAPRLRRLAQTWASGAARLVRDCEPGPPRLGWLQTFFAARAALLSHDGEGAAWAVTAGELAVLRLRRSIPPPEPPGPTTRPPPSPRPCEVLMVAPDEQARPPEQVRGGHFFGGEADGRAIAQELLDAGRPERELEQVTGAAPGDAVRWAAGSAALTPVQAARLHRWRDALAVGLEAASGRDARYRLPSGYWREVPLGAPLPVVDLTAAPPAYDHEAQLAVGRWRNVAGAALAELLALAAASPEGWRAATTELWDLQDELHRRAAGWRLDAGVVRARARDIVAELSVGGVTPVEVRAVPHRGHRELDLTVWWSGETASAAPPLRSDVGAEARVAGLLGVAADGVTVRSGRHLAEAEQEGARLGGVDLVALVAGGAPPVALGHAPDAPAPSHGDTPAPAPGAARAPGEHPSQRERPSRDVLEDALRLHARDLPWALRVDAVVPVAAWAAVIDTVRGAEIELVCQWRDVDGTPGGEELRLRRAAADALGVPVGAVSVLGPGDLPLDVLVQLPETGVRLVPPWSPTHGPL